MSKPVRVAVVTLAPFPIGNVSTMRYTSYLRSLTEVGIYTYVLIYSPTRMAATNVLSSGEYQGVNFQYATDITWRKYNIYNRIKYLIIGLINSVGYLRKNNINTIILYGDNPFIVNLFFRIVCSLRHMRYIGDRSELPSLSVRHSTIRLYLYGLKQRMLDGLIVMTKELRTFYSQYYSNESDLFLLPMTVDPHRFDKIEKQSVTKQYIAVVFGTHNRDGLIESIQSYIRYREKGGSFEIQLIGDFEAMPNKEELKLAINTSSWINSIHIMGLVPNEKVPHLLKNASCLLTTPNEYISGGFPTKLGEYMLSGTPIVATEAGELTDYITSGKEMILCKPGNVEEISSALLTIENDPNYAESLSLCAKLTAESKFCADSYINTFTAFLAGKNNKEREGILC